MTESCAISSENSLADIVGSGVAKGGNTQMIDDPGVFERD
jgi:hypothetical protein